MLVSIIVPFYNVEPYFRRCLDSIVNQSYRNLEIILVNDCSPDNSIAIAREYAAKDDRIVIIEHEKNLGLGGARNSGIYSAKGEYIWFIDSDDEVTSPYAIEHLVAIAKRDTADVVIFNAQSMREDRELKTLYNFYPYAIEQVFNEQRPFYPVFCQVVMEGNRCNGYFGSESCFRLFRLSFLKDHSFKFKEHTIHEDLPHLALLALARHVTIVPYIYYNYYQRSNSIMGSGIPINYLEHLDRQLEHINEIYNALWVNRQLSKMALIVLMLNHSSIHTYRLLANLQKPNQQDQFKAKAISYYHLITEYAKDLVLMLDDQQLWPSTLSHQQELRQMLISYNQPLSDDRRVKLVRDYLGLHPKRPVNPVKKAIKMLLPYGFIRLVQICKDKRKHN